MTHCLCICNCAARLPAVCFCPSAGDVDLFLVNPPAGQEHVILSKIYDVVMKEFFLRGISIGCDSDSRAGG